MNEPHTFARQERKRTSAFFQSRDPVVPPLIVTRPFPSQSTGSGYETINQRSRQITDLGGGACAPPLPLIFYSVFLTHGFSRASYRQHWKAWMGLYVVMRGRIKSAAAYISGQHTRCRVLYQLPLSIYQLPVTDGIRTVFGHYLCNLRHRRMQLCAGETACADPSSSPLPFCRFLCSSETQ